MKIKGLYGIVNLLSENDKEQAVSQAVQATKGDCSILQLRAKHVSAKTQQEVAKQIRDICNSKNCLFLINDNPCLALESAADGVHIGQNDTSLTECRKLLGDKAVIGVSCHNSLDLAKQAENDSANYVAFGRFFPSRTKPEAPPAQLETLHAAQQQLNIPIVAIGGINLDNAQQVITAGADAIAVIDALFASNHIENTAKQFVELFN